MVLDVRTGVGAVERALLGEASSTRTVVAVNKMDAVRRSSALPVLAELGRLVPDIPAVPVSARTGLQLEVLVGEIAPRLPPGPPVFSDDDFTTASTRFLAQEVIREQVFLQTRAEVPYDAAVVVESMTDEGELTRVDAVILVGRDRHKGMLIGSGGERVKAIGTSARPALEALLGRRVHLALEVKVEPDWLARPERLEALELA